MKTIACIAACLLFVLSACGTAAEQEENAVVNPTSCEATNDLTRLRCAGTGIEGALYDCECERLSELPQDCGFSNDACADGQQCRDRRCYDIAIFSDRDICIDGLSAEDVAQRCAGLPN